MDDLASLSVATSSCVSLYSGSYNEDASVTGLENLVATEPISFAKRARSEFLNLPVVST